MGKENIAMWVAYRLPKRVLRWAYIRVVAHSTSGKYDTTIVPELGAMDALKRFEDDLL
jgi:hypothetical protein